MRYAVQTKHLGGWPGIKPNRPVLLTFGNDGVKIGTFKKTLVPWDDITN
jgi:hypothetical protein